MGAHLQAVGVAPERITEIDWWQSHRQPFVPLTEFKALPRPSKWCT